MLLQRIGAAAAFVNALQTATRVLIVLVGLGFAGGAPPDPAALLAEQPGALLALEGLKLLNALTLIGVAAALVDLAGDDDDPIMLFVALCAVALAALLLVASGVVGTAAIAQSAGVEAYTQATALVDWLGRAGLFGSGFFFLAMHVGVRATLPDTLAWFGVALGAVTVLAGFAPSFSFIFLVVSVVWAIWMGSFLLRA